MPIEHEYDPVIYKDAHYVTTCGEFAAAMAAPEPPFPIAKDVIEGYFDPSDTPAYKRMADLLEDVYKNPPRDEPMGEGFTPHFNKVKFCALAGVHFLYRHGWEPKKVFAFCPAGQFCPAHLWVCGQSPCNAGTGGSNDGTH